jgi:hypothetical protein
MSNLKELHTKLTLAMLAEVAACAEAQVPIPAADKAAMVKFLKDNNVVEQPGVSDKLRELQERMQQKAIDNRAKVKSALSETDVAALYIVN